MTVDDPQIRALLADRDVKCPRCRYNLHGLGVGKCPECGLAFSARDVRDLLRAPRLERWCIAGGALGVLACAAWTVLILLGLDKDALNVLALWVPALGAALLLGCGLNWLEQRRRDPLRRARQALRHGVILWIITLAWTGYLVLALAME